MVEPTTCKANHWTLDAVKVIVALPVTQLAPLCLGLGIRHWLPGLATRIQRPANLLSAILNLAAIGIVLVVCLPLLSAIRLRGYRHKPNPVGPSL